MKTSDVGELRIQSSGDGVRFVYFEVEGTGIGKNDAFVVKAQVHGVGAQPVAVIDLLSSRFAEQAQSAKRGIIQPEMVGQCVFESPARLARQFGMGSQPFKAGGHQFPEGQLVVRFGPDQFGEKQGEAHG